MLHISAAKSTLEERDEAWLPILLEKYPIKAGDVLTIDGIRKAVEADGTATLKVGSKSIAVKTSLSDREKHLILCGGLLASL